MLAAGRMSIRPARPGDAGFIARVILAAQRGPVPRGWIDIALDRDEPECLAFIARLAVAPTRSWYHVAHFLVAEVDGWPAAALCAMPAAGTLLSARAAIAEVAAESGIDVAAIGQRGAYARDCWVQGGDGEWGLRVRTGPLNGQFFAGRDSAPDTEIATIQSFSPQAAGPKITICAGSSDVATQASVTFLLANWRRIARKCRQRPYAFLLHVDTHSGQARLQTGIVEGQPFIL